MYNDTITEHDIMETVRESAKEILKYNTEARDLDDVIDEIHDTADGLVNPYYYACAHEWLVVGMPSPEDFDLEGEGDINRRIAIAMYGWYSQRLTEEVEELLDEREDDN
jgi:hypothetical protein